MVVSSQTARMQYTATSFAEPVQRVFDDVLRPVRDLDVTHVAESRYVIESVSYRSTRGRRNRSAPLRTRHQCGPALGQWLGDSSPGACTGTWPTGLGALVVVLVAVSVIR